MTGAAPALAEIELEEGALVIADLHLDLAEADPGPGFAGWLEALGSPPALVVLGDLFDAWVGPAQERLPGGGPVLDALAALSGRGCRIELVVGNRDFLLGGWFERRTGARVRRRGLVGRLGGARVLFVHGDELCTDDRGYQRLRRVLRSGPLVWLVPRLPGFLSLAIARGLRRASRSAVGAKAPLEMSLRPEACRALAARHEAGVLVCGHAHRFRDESLPGGPRWLVLGAFGQAPDVLRVGPAGALELRRSTEKGIAAL